MFLPLGTDAPVYYGPIATVAMIVVNVVVYFLFRGLDPDVTARYVLQYGNGLLDCKGWDLYERGALGRSYDDRKARARPLEGGETLRPRATPRPAYPPPTPRAVGPPLHR